MRQIETSRKNKQDRLWNEAGLWSSIERYRRQQRDIGLKGRCYEKALLRSFGIQKNEGLATRVQHGVYKGTKHSWLEVYDPGKGKWVLDDPSQGINYTNGYTTADVKGYEPKSDPKNLDWEIKDEGSKAAYREMNK